MNFYDRECVLADCFKLSTIATFLLNLSKYAKENKGEDAGGLGRENFANFSHYSLGNVTLKEKEEEKKGSSTRYSWSSGI